MASIIQRQRKTYYTEKCLSNLVGGLWISCFKDFSKMLKKRTILCQCFRVYASFFWICCFKVTDPGEWGAPYIWMFPKIVGFPPKSSILIILIGVFHYFHHPIWGTPIFWKHPSKPNMTPSLKIQFLQLE